MSDEKRAQNRNDNPKKEDEMDTIAMTAVYPHDAAYARAHGELAEYRNARRSNIAYKNAIEEAIAKHFDGMHLDEACV